MHALNSLRTANLLIVDVSRGAVAALNAARPGSQPLVLTLNRDAQGAASGGFGAPAQATSFAFESIFSVNYIDANKLKIHLMERVGKAFGLDVDDFPDAGSMAREIDQFIEKMSASDVAAMEKELGLDKLGVSLRDVIEAMKEPGGASDRKLDAALSEQAGDMLDEQEQVAKGGLNVRFDEIGRYFISGSLAA